MSSEKIDVKTDGIIYRDRPGYYFGYGLESDPEVMEAIVGHPLPHELGVLAVNRKLAIQDIDQVPNIPVAVLGGESVQENIARSWAKHTGVAFTSYVLRHSENRGDFVKGTLFEIGIDDAEALVEWDLADPDFERGATWRFWDHAVELTDGRPAITLTVAHDAEIDRVVDGMDYKVFLNDQEATIKVIQDFVAERDV